MCFLQETYRACDSRMTQEGLRRHVLRVLRMWRSWSIFSDDFLNGLQVCLVTLNHHLLPVCGSPSARFECYRVVVCQFRRLSSWSDTKSINHCPCVCWLSSFVVNKSVQSTPHMHLILFGVCLYLIYCVTFHIFKYCAGYLFERRFSIIQQKVREPRPGC